MPYDKSVASQKKTTRQSVIGEQPVGEQDQRQNDTDDNDANNDDWQLRLCNHSKQQLVGCVVQLAERRSLADKLTLSYARPAADG